MCKNVQRGYAPGDQAEFGGNAVPKLRRAAQNLYYLLNQGYPIKGASVFVGKYCGQPLSAFRETATGIGESRVLTGAQVALSDSLLLRCMDGTVRDLAALRGTCRLIDKTTRAIEMVGRMLEKGGVGKAVFYLDSPVSNSGRLKERIGALLEEYPFADFAVSEE